MANKLYEEEDIRGIAESIRTKNGLSDTYNVKQMKQAVLDIPGGDPYAAFRALVGRSLTEITAEMLAGMTTIGQMACAYLVGLTSVVIPDSVVTIRDAAFAYGTTSALSTTITIGNGVTTIGAEAFRNGTKITSVDIGSAVTYIGARAFYNLTSCLSFTCRATTPPTIEATTLSGINGNCVYYVPAESVDAYKTETNWSVVAGQIQAIPA